jgi:hypothetical protein
MKPESPRLEDAHRGRQGNESREGPPRFRQHAFPGTVLHRHRSHRHRSGCPLKTCVARPQYVGWFGVCLHRADSRPTRAFPQAGSSLNSSRSRDAIALSTNRRVFLTRRGPSCRLRQKCRCRPWIRHALANHIEELAVVHRLLEESRGPRLQRLLFVELRTAGGQHNDRDTR